MTVLINGETGLSGASSGSAASDSAASSEAGPPTDKRLESLNTLLTALDSSELGADVTRIEFVDPEQMAFLYQGRLSVLLGTLNELDYKLRLAKYVLLNEDGKGCSPTDTGMLDLSHLSASSSRKFRFAQGEPTLPSGWTAPEEPAAPADKLGYQITCYLNDSNQYFIIKAECFYPVKSSSCERFAQCINQ